MSPLNIIFVMTPICKMMIVLMMMLPFSLALLGQVPGLYIDRITFWNQGGTVYEMNANGYTFTLAWRGSLPSIKSAGLGLYNYESGPHKVLSFMAELTFTTTASTQVALTLNTPDSGITYLAFSVIVITEINNYVELLTFIQNSPIPALTQYNISSQRFLFSVNNPSRVNFIQWLHAYDLTNASPQYIETWIQTAVLVPNQITLTFRSQTAKLGGARVNILLVVQANATNSISYYPFDVWDGTGCLDQFTQNFGVTVSDYGDPVWSKNCLMGLQYISLKFYRYTSNHDSQSFLFTFNGATLTAVSSVNTHCNILQGACFGYGCSERYYPDVSSVCQMCNYDCFTCENATHCLTCSSSLDFRQLNSSTSRCDPLPGYYESGITISKSCQTGCLYCSNATVCLACRTDFIQTITTSGVECTSCSSMGLVRGSNGDCVCEMGTLMQGQCVEIVGCLNIAIELNGAINCIACDTALFKAAPVNNVCECSNGGTFTNGICSTIAGFPAISINLSGEVSCLSCNITQHFNPTPDASGQCTCQNKYESIEGNCQDICGDGFLMINLGSTCDDGNLVDLDGCSSTCQVETGYRCQNGSTTTPSECLYAGTMMTIELASTKHTEGLNQAVFEISVYPPLFNIKYMNLYHYVSFQCETVFTIPDISYQLGTLLITTDYTDDMEGRFCNLTISYNQSIIRSDPSTISFNVHSDDSPLFYSSTFSDSQNSTLIFRILAYVALAIFVVSLPLKMAGVELMACCQIVYLSLRFYLNPTSLVKSLKEFSPVTGFWSLLSQEEDRNLIKGFTDRMELSPFFLESSAIITGALVFSAVLALSIIVVSFVRKGQERVLINGDENNNTLASRAVKLVYHVLLFPITAGFMLVLLLEGYLNNRRLSVTRQCFFPLWVNSLGLLFAWLMMAIVLFVQLFAVKQVLVLQQSREMKSYYPSIFMGKLTLFYFLVVVGLSVSLDLTLYALLTLELLFFIFLLFTRIYLSVFMKLVALACEATVIYALSLPILGRFYSPTEQIQVFLFLILQGMIVVVELMVIVRVLMGYCRLLAPKVSLNETEESFKKKKKKRERRLKDPTINKGIETRINPYNPMNYDNGTLDVSLQMSILDRRLIDAESQELRAIKQRLRESFGVFKEKANQK